MNTNIYIQIYEWPVKSFKQSSKVVEGDWLVKSLKQSSRKGIFLYVFVFILYSCMITT